MTLSGVRQHGRKHLYYVYWQEKGLDRVHRKEQLASADKNTQLRSF